ESACRMLGYNRRHLLAKTVFAIDASLTEASWQAAWQRVREGNPETIESLHLRRDGTQVPVEIVVSHTEIDGVECCCAVVRDLTSRKKTARQVEQLRFTVENAPDAVYLFDVNGGIYYANRTACRSLGYTEAELMRMNIRDLDPQLAESWHDASNQTDADGQAVILETSQRRKDGSCYPVEIVIGRAEHDGQQFAAAFVRDITERRESLRKLEELRFAIENTRDPIYFYDAAGRITYANHSASRAVGYTAAELAHLTVFDLNPEMSPEQWARSFRMVLAGKRGVVETVNRAKDGTVFPVEVTATNVVLDGREFGFSVNRDISERLRAERAQQESEERFRMIAETSPVALIISRASDGMVLYANRQVEKLLGKPSDAIINTSLFDIFDAVEAASEVIAELVSAGELRGSEILFSRDDGTRLWLSLSAKSVELQGTTVMCCALLDITAIHELTQQLSFQATYDSLTGLVNRREFESRLQAVIARSDAKSQNALCYLDLDQFKVINDTCGHSAGDELLRQIGPLLHTSVRKHDTLARLGGDEFAVLIENCSLRDAERVAHAIRRTVQDYRFGWDGNNFTVGVSIGLVPISVRDDVSDVLRRADAACYAAKDSGRNRIHVYRPDDEELAERHGEMQWIARLSDALDHDRLQLWKQRIAPTVAGEAGEHYELLIRMVDKQGRLIPPGAFLPAAERYNMALRVDRWVIQKMFDWFATQPVELDRLSLCSINLSGQSLSDGEFLREIIEHFRESPVSPEKICFEVTETAAIANMSYAVKFMNALRSLGCRFALDDFGSGLSSFAYLKTLTVDYIKIDGLFVKDILTDPIDLAMVKSINEVGHVMGKKTIAEFVENEQILEQLRVLGVDYVQGYGVAKPEPLFQY
ncbi:MAG: PAS domain S-box protein, partial [Gammaproteobacteria bacterium]|nr:PAS domain S-box protein [Gammaproteobacteria bacterium]